MKLLRPSAIYHSLTRVMFRLLVQKGYGCRRLPLCRAPFKDNISCSSDSGSAAALAALLCRGRNRTNGKKRSSFKASARPVYEIYLGVYSHRNTAKADAVKAQSTTDFTGIYEGKQTSCKHKPGLQENPIPIVLTRFLNWVETHKPVKVFPDQSQCLLEDQDACQ